MSKAKTKSNIYVHNIAYINCYCECNSNKIMLLHLTLLTFCIKTI